MYGHQEGTGTVPDARTANVITVVAEAKAAQWDKGRDSLAPFNHLRELSSGRNSL